MRTKRNATHIQRKLPILPLPDFLFKVLAAEDFALDAFEENADESGRSAYNQDRKRI
jgi:hypothetical protein